MIILNIAEWCINLLLFSLSLLITAVAIFIFLMLATLAWNAWERSSLKEQFKTRITKGE